MPRPKWSLEGLDKENLKRLYIDQKLSAGQISALTGHDEFTVRRYMRKHYIHMRTHSEVMKGRNSSLRIPGVTKEILEEMYNDKWMTTSEIGKHFDCSRNAIIYALKRYDIPLHTSRIKGMDEATLRRFYIDKEWSTIRIAEYFGCKTDETVRKALMKYDIPVRSKSEAGKVKTISEKEMIRLRAMGKATKSGSEHPAWKGGKSVNKDGYVVIRIDGKAVLEHRYVMEQHLNRKLEPWEEVNHINGDKLNNNSDNLEVIYSEHKHKDHLRRQAQQQS